MEKITKDNPIVKELKEDILKIKLHLQTLENKLNCLIGYQQENYCFNKEEPQQEPHDIIKKTHITSPSNIINTSNNSNLIQFERPTFPLPFMGIKLEGFCQAIKESYGIYNQCINVSKINYTHPKYQNVYLCDNCSKTVKNHEPKFGLIQERIEKADNYITKKNKKPLPYSKVLEKLKVNLSFVTKELLKFGVSLLPNDEIKINGNFNIKTEYPVISKNLLSSCEDNKRKRGRPRKIQHTFEINNQDYEESEETEDIEHIEHINNTEINIPGNGTNKLTSWDCKNGLVLLKDDENKLYGINGKCIGYWSDEYNKVIEIEYDYEY
jgi:hypothetical protein